MDDQSKALSSRGVVDSGTMRSLVRAQEATGKAHVTIQVNRPYNTQHRRKRMHYKQNVKRNRIQYSTHLVGAFIEMAMFE